MKKTIEKAMLVPLLPPQSNEPLEDKPANGKGRINSGLYFVRAEGGGIQAMTAIVAHAAATALLEQVRGVGGNAMRGVCWSGTTRLKRLAYRAHHSLVPVPKEG